jgi:uncharacterized RDD family membrane protein YckC
MNLEINPSKKNQPINVVDDLDFDFKPITSGLGFHHQKTTEVKPAFPEMDLPKANTNHVQIKREVRTYTNAAPVYQNDLSLFYGHELKKEVPAEEKIVEKTYHLASASQRVIAYILDLSTVLSFLGVVLTVMARLIHMDLMEAWSTYPNEITPLVVTLFVGFYLIYFSIFEKTQQSTLGKSMIGITVLSVNNKPQSFLLLVLRSFLTLANFISLGLFSYFDLQNKVSKTKVVRTL